MATHAIMGDEIGFRPRHIGNLIARDVPLGIGGACRALAARQHPAWLIGATLAGRLTLALVSRYTAGGMLVRSIYLVFCCGSLFTREVSLPIWEARLEIRQGLLGQLLDAGVVA